MFCHQCGDKLAPFADYCRRCGAAAGACVASAGKGGGQPPSAWAYRIQPATWSEARGSRVGVLGGMEYVISDRTWRRSAVHRCAACFAGAAAAAASAIAAVGLISTAPHVAACACAGVPVGLALSTLSRFSRIAFDDQRRVVRYASIPACLRPCASCRQQTVSYDDLHDVLLCENTHRRVLAVCADGGTLPLDDAVDEKDAVELLGVWRAFLRERKAAQPCAPDERPAGAGGAEEA